MNKIIKNGQFSPVFPDPNSFTPKHRVPNPNETVFHDYDKALFCDVDETLVFVRFPESRRNQTIDFDYFGYKAKILPHWKHVELIKDFRVRGIGVFVWSAGGARWAYAVIKALGLEGYVHVLPKPSWIIDDKSPGLWLNGTRFYLDFDTGKEISNLKEQSINIFEEGSDESVQTSETK